MVDFDKAPPVSDALLEFVEEALDTEAMLTEEDTEGLERLGFIKGVHFVKRFLRFLQRAGKEAEDAQTLQV